ncbi:MAG: DUF5615 family PIN-like protein [Bacteroidia bacterium]
MKLLLDQNISFRTVRYLQPAVPEITHLKFVGLLNAEDYRIWDFAHLNNYAIVTFDIDFYELQIIKGFPPKIIWLRTGNMTRQVFVNFFLKNLDAIHEFLSSREFEDVGCLELS